MQAVGTGIETGTPGASEEQPSLKLDRVMAGEIYLDGVALSTLPEGDLTRLRREKVRFVFQLFELIRLAA